MGKRYKNSPIMEVLCEFQFIPTQPWDITIPGLLYEKIKKQFPIKKQQTGFDIGIQPKGGGIEQKVEMSQRMQFFRSDKSALIQISPDLLIINHLKPYPAWEIFKPLILQNLKIYQEIAKPKAFKRIRLRYINKIEFDKGPIELTDYFNYYPFIPTKLPQTHGAFNVSIEIPYEYERDRLHLTLASTISEKPEVLSLLLNFDLIKSPIGLKKHIPLLKTPLKHVLPINVEAFLRRINNATNIN